MHLIGQALGRLQEACNCALQTCKKTLAQLRVLNYLSAVERGAQGGRVSVFAAQSTAHTTINDGSHRIYFKGVRIVFECQSGTTREPKPMPS